MCRLGASLARSKADRRRIDFAQDFFGREAFLTVSGQLNVEAYCLALTKVYTFGPTFHAENSNTSGHLAEFWMIEPEIAFADLSDNAALAERLLKYTFAAFIGLMGLASKTVGRMSAGVGPDRRSGSRTVWRSCDG